MPDPHLRYLVRGSKRLIPGFLRPTAGDEQVSASALQLGATVAEMPGNGVGRDPDLLIPAIATADVLNVEAEAAQKRPGRRD